MSKANSTIIPITSTKVNSANKKARISAGLIQIVIFLLSSYFFFTGNNVIQKTQ